MKSKKTKKKSKKNNKKELFLLLLIILIIIGIIISVSVFSKKDSKENNNGNNNNNNTTIASNETNDPSDVPDPEEIPEPEDEPTPEPVDPAAITKLEKHVLQNTKSVEFNLNGKKIVVRNVDGKLYSNGEYIMDSGTCPMEFYNEENCSTLYETNKFILITTERDRIEYSHIINENGKIVKIIRDTADTGNEGIDTLNVENGKLLAYEYTSSTSKRVEFSYKNGNMHIIYFTE